MSQLCNTGLLSDVNYAMSQLCNTGLLSDVNRSILLMFTLKDRYLAIENTTRNVCIKKYARLYK